MCFPNYWKHHKTNNLIRRGCEQGDVEIVMEDGTKIFFHLQHANQWFEMQRPGEELLQFWTKEIPEEVNRELGLIYDEELHIILNVLIKDVPYPLIATSPQWNARVLSIPLTNEKLETSIMNAKTWMDELLVEFKRIDRLLKRKQSDYNMMRSVNIGILESAKESNAQLLTLAQCLEEMQVQAMVLRDNLDLYAKVNNGIRDLVAVSDLKKLSEVYRQLVPSFLFLRKNLQVLKDTERYEGTLELKQLYELCVMIGNLSNTVKNIQANLKWYVSSTQNQREYAKVLSTAKNLLEIKPCVRDLWGELRKLKASMNEYIIVSKRYGQSTKALEALKQELGVCPLCGTALVSKESVN